ncbi:reverse transcriptase RNA-dependent DNA polymerase [Nitzschia inconspicua]|uniref:Reverse transcriptase RNA-dependent DNA polymerase n=1 Tax=Nitzschia inconspicua TaxID=303405 RepID=A0A9K3KK10_9STRA|nr:reverse transcriptase RNA-dependent DNA polymerase [Nitzschia inconspicua]
MSRKTKGQRPTVFDEEQDPPAQTASTDDEQLLSDILKKALGLKEANGPVTSALKKYGVTSIDTLLGLDYYDIKHMTFDAPDGFGDDGITPKFTSMELPRGHQSLLIHLNTFILHEYEDNGNDIRGDWTLFDADAFKKYRGSPEALTRYQQFKGTHVGPPQPGPTQLNQVPPSSGSIQQNLDPANKAIQDWKRGVKRDPTIFNDLSSDAIWESWNRSFTSTIGVQMLGHLLDSDYTPQPNTPEAAVFHLEREYVYDVLHRVVKTDKGREIIRKHFSTKDAQKAYEELHTHSQRSAGALISTNEIYQYLIHADITEWSGYTEKFLLHWFEQVRLYENNADPSAFLSDTQKLQLLANAVQGHPTLCLVQDQLDAITAYDPKKKPTIEQYKSLLFNAAVRKDRNLKGGSKKSIARRVYMHESEQPQLQEYGTYCSDTPSYQVMRSETSKLKPPSTSVPPRTKATLRWDQWRDLPDAARQLWDKLDKGDKWTILRYHDPSQPKTQRVEAKYHDLAQEIDDQHGFTQLVVYGVNQHNTSRPSPVHQPEPVSHPTDKAKDNGVIQGLPPGHPQRMLSKAYSVNTNETKSVTMTFGKDKITFNTNVHRISYNASKSSISRRTGALVDCGANGGIGGADVRKLHDIADTVVDITGIENHQVRDVPLAVVAGVLRSNRGPIIGIFNNYAYTGKGRTIHSSPDHFGHDLDEKSKKVGGSQRIITKNGYVIPLSISNGLPYISMRPPTDKELDMLPHEIMTSPAPWDPAVLDYNIDSDDDDFYDALEDSSIALHDHVDEYGDYRQVFYTERMLHNASADGIDVDLITAPLDDARLFDFFSFSHNVSPKPPDFDRLRPNFLYKSDEVIQKTFERSTQMARIPMSHHLRTWYRSPNPAMNVPRRNEDLLTDYVYSDVPAIDDGSTGAQVFFGRDTHVCDVYGLKSESHFPNALQENIRQRGAPNRLVSDSATYETSKRVHVILNDLHIGDWQSEPHHQHQNPAERRWQDIKRLSNDIMDRTGCFPSCWLLVRCYVMFVMTHLANPALNWDIPLQRLTGNTVDISILLRYPFWHKVYANVPSATYPSDTREQLCWMLHGESLKQHIKSKHDMLQEISTVSDEHTTNLPIDVTGRSVVIPQENGEKLRATIIEVIANSGDKSTKGENTEFRLAYEKFDMEEILTYQQIMEYLDEDERNQRVWKFNRISGHQGPLKQCDPDYKGSSFNVMIEWENGEVTTEPLNIIAEDDPVTCAIYALDNDLLDTPGWMRFKKLARRQKKLFRMANQAKLRSFRTAPRYMYGIEIPRDYQHALELDQKNGNTLWQDCTALELSQMKEYRTFKDIGKGKAPPPGYKKIRVHLVYACKHDGRRKARLVADGHLTDIPIDSVYSGVVSLRGLRMMIFLAELNNLSLWATDIGNAYLEAYTLEKFYITAGKEFGDLEGHTLIVSKALYGLRSSGLRWHEKFADCLRDEGFQPSKGEPDIWMREKDGLYEYVAVYVDDLAFAMRDPKS